MMIRFGLVKIFAAANGPVNVFAAANGSVNFLERYLPIHKILLFAGAIVPVFTDPNSCRGNCPSKNIAAANVPVKLFCLGNITGTILTQTSVQAGAVLMPLAMFLLSLKSIRVLY